ncbi:MAG: hypothetical protein B0D92_01335 [Spirochaeta sp. LUC14_002_19_P3]|nr:MAG: hypothetical protein B0D92_01335 [Spirochaeta sp. LUC14_002_19_P3]
MRRILIAMVFTFIIAMSVWGLDEKGKGVIYTTNSQVIQADEILANFGRKWNVTVILDDGERIKSNLAINTIKRLEIIKWDTEEEWWIEAKVVLRNELGKAAAENGDMPTAKEDVNKFELEYMIIANPDSLFQRDEQYVVYKKYDPINHELVSNRIWSKSISTVEFGPNTGSYKVDALGHKFNPDYIYSPYTGEIMEFGSSGNDTFKTDSLGNKFSPEYMYSPYTGERLSTRQ